jgi:hypothetical protein
MEASMAKHRCMKAIPPSRRRSLAAIGLSAACLCWSGSLQAQVLTGRVVSADSLRGIPAAFIQAFDGEENRVGAGLTNAEGQFQLELPAEGGPFRLRIDAFAFERASVEVPQVRGGESLTLEDIVLSPAPVVLDEITAQADRPRLTPGREWVRRNQLHGTGTFLAGALISRDAPNSLGAYVAERTELWVDYNSRGQPILYNPRAAMSRCVDILVNRWPLEQTGFRSIDDIPADAIAAIEIYDSDRNRPPGYYFEGRPGCGLIQVWLWNSY